MIYLLFVTDYVIYVLKILEEGLLLVMLCTASPESAALPLHPPLLG